LKIKDDGTINLGGICLVAGLGGSDRRDGTPAYYYSEPVVENEAKGTAPFILAYTEILKRQK
jgi:unsaturated rhamnogalacturonyl hydrolase